LITKKLRSHEEAIKTRKELEELTETIDTTKGAIGRALTSDFSDVEDAIPYHCAKTNRLWNEVVTRIAKECKCRKGILWSPEQAIRFYRKGYPISAILHSCYITPY
jgi:hypothetical protein